MIAADSSSMVAYFQGEKSSDAIAVAEAIANDKLYLPPVVVTELLSYPKASAAIEPVIAALPLLPILDGYWERAGKTRRKILALGLKARLPDTLIAQICIDHQTPLIANDGDYRHFEKHCGLILA